MTQPSGWKLLSSAMFQWKCGASTCLDVHAQPGELFAVPEWEFHVENRARYRAMMVAAVSW
jgi:hypothetical protein